MSKLAKIGRYRVERRLGAGAFATVWLASDDALESWVAIKILADNWAHHPDVRARFEQEAQLLRRADSERLIRVHDFGELPDGRPYQVMTYAAGGTLAERLLTGPMPVRVALRTAADIARAVTDLHEAGVLHRDLKPSNVLFDTVRGTERVLVADLGLAKAIAHASGFTVVAGTPGYMAPEQSLPGGGLDVRADVHAVGAIAYQMLTGRPPQPGPAAPSTLRAGIPKQVDRIVLRALDTERNRRWPTAAALATALNDVADAPPRRRNRAWQLIGRTVGASIAVSGLAIVGGSAAAQATPGGWVRVTDSTGALSLAVPPEWAGQIRDSGWNPAIVALPGGAEPGLAVAGDLTAWAEPDGGGPGVFAGTAVALTDPVFPRHDECTRHPGRRLVLGGLTGRVEIWTDCAGTSVSYREVTLGGLVYLQIKQVDQADRTEEVLGTLRVAHS